MDTPGFRKWMPAALAMALSLIAGLWWGPSPPLAARAAGGFFVAKGQEVVQPALQVFLTWDPQTRVETLTVQPRFESSTPDLALVIATPSRPKLLPAPRDLFRHLAVFTLLKTREFPESQLLPADKVAPGGGADGAAPAGKRGPAVVLFESGFVGALDYRIVSAARADELYKWLKANEYHYAGDEATLNAYVQKRWVFTVLKIDAGQARKARDGKYVAELTPTRLQFTTDKLVYPLPLARPSAKDRMAVLFYVLAPFKADLPGDLSYQHTWIPMLQAASGRADGLPGKGAEWLVAAKAHLPGLLQRGRELGFGVTPGQGPRPNPQRRTPTTLEWARRLTEHDVKVLRGEAPYSERLPDVDDGFTQADLKDPKRADAIYTLIGRRQEQARRARPLGYLVRHAPPDDVQDLRALVSQLRAGLFLTRFRKVFTRDEMAADLEIGAARLGPAEDASEYEEALPVSSP